MVSIQSPFLHKRANRQITVLAALNDFQTFYPHILPYCRSQLRAILFLQCINGLPMGYISYLRATQLCTQYSGCWTEP